MNSKDFFLSWGMILIGTFMNVIGVYLIKAKINDLGNIQFDSFRIVLNYFFALARSPQAMLGAIFIMAAPFPYAIALSRLQLSVAYPLSVALNCLLILPLSILYLGESVTLGKLAAIGMIIASLYFLYK